jgi:cell wall-associated NlpC family hydrolase
VLVCALACAAGVGGVAGGAQADPAGGASPGTPSRAQLDQANQAANRARVALTPAQAELAAAQRRLAALETAAQQAQQRYAQATAHEQAARRAAASADRHAQDTAAFAAASSTVLGRLVAAAYREGAAADLSSLTIVLDVKDPRQYMNGVRVVKRLVASQSSVLTQAKGAERDAAAARTQADRSAAALTAAEAAVARSAQAARAAADVAQAQVDTLGKQVDALLAQQASAQQNADALALARQRAGAAQSSGTGDASSGGGSAAYSTTVADQVLAYALAQLGKPYVWGGTGPDSFDCSGLAMRAYESAGIGLPHFAAFQYQASHPLAYDQLQPGDLLFWATDPSDSNTIYHEAIYLGDQKMVQAPKTGWNVMISNLWMWGPIQFYARPSS